MHIHVQQCVLEYMCVYIFSIGMLISSDFSEDDGSLRMDDSSCSSPTGKVDVRNALVITHCKQNIHDQHDEPQCL